MVKTLLFARIPASCFRCHCHRYQFKSQAPILVLVLELDTEMVLELTLENQNINCHGIWNPMLVKSPQSSCMLQICKKRYLARTRTAR